MDWWRDPGFTTVLIVTAIVVVGFIVGTVRNRRLLEEYLARLRGPLLQYADKASARRLGTSGYHILVPKAKRPFRKIDALLFVQPREFLFYWLVNRLRGRGDRLYLHVTLLRPPVQEVRAGAHAERPTQEEGTAWHRVATSPWRGPLYVHGEPSSAMTQFLEKLAHHVPHLYQLTLRRKAPHISLVIPLRDLPDVQAVEHLFALLAQIPVRSGRGQ